MDSPSDSVIVFTGGDPLPPGALADLATDAFVIAADSGLDHAQLAGWHVDVAVGDFDSATPAAIDQARRSGTVIDEHPQAKDHTDLELALSLAADRHPRRITVVGGHGGRLDHLLANALALSVPARAGIEVEAIMGGAHVAVVTDRRTFTGAPGELVTLLPLHGPAHGVCTEGLLYPLIDETLEPGSSRGVSNQLMRSDAEVSLADGVLLVVQPGEQGPPLPADDHTPEEPT